MGSVLGLCRSTAADRMHLSQARKIVAGFASCLLLGWQGIKVLTLGNPFVFIPMVFVSSYHSGLRYLICSVAL
ncbi:hypothetical protein OH492_15255 [Vibrio chagasii]|nr:hypothetical protein [Vibrio chagasii]